MVIPSLAVNSIFLVPCEANKKPFRPSLAVTKRPSGIAFISHSMSLSSRTKMVSPVLALWWQLRATEGTARIPSCFATSLHLPFMPQPSMARTRACTQHACRFVKQELWCLHLVRRSIGFLHLAMEYAVLLISSFARYVYLAVTIHIQE